jgi:uncharacterized Ntn-hydrolase superfamily protein
VTFSIVAQDGEAFGVAVASKFPFVGSVVPVARLGVGAVATQAMARVAYRDVALAALACGSSADAAVRACTEPDEQRDHRQLGVVGTDSQATWTGPSCLPWAGGVSGRDARGGYAIQGNILAGPQVVAEMEQAWLASAGSSFTDRLVAALLAGDAAGGDSRGRQGAALYAASPGAGYDQSGVLADVRVDDHPDAPRELARLVGLSDLMFGAPEDVLPLEGELGEEVVRRLASLGFDAGSGLEAGSGLGAGDAAASPLSAHSESPAAALAAWASEENYETRLSPDGIDAKVLEALRRATR